jgi:hypothetical protein
MHVEREMAFAGVARVEHFRKKQVGEETTSVDQRRLDLAARAAWLHAQAT